MNKIWLTSDWHFNHDKPFIYEPRGFTNIEEMNETIIKIHNSMVDYDDDVYCLGDCMLGDNELGLKCIKSLKGKIHIIRGNHCTDTRIELYKTCDNVIEVLGYANILKYMGYHFYLSHYPTLTSNYDDNKLLKRRVINLCGHSHTKDKFIDMDKGLIYHVELDAHQNKPVLIDDIIEDIKNYIKE
jgi:calcineurin-like phosphoesterase family protein